MKTFERLIEKHYPGLNFILIPDERYMPGAIINNNDQIIDHINKIHLFDENKCITKVINTTIANNELTYENSLSFDFSLLGLIKLVGKSKKKYKVNFEYKNVKSVVFNTIDANGYYENDIKEILMNLKKSDRSRFLRIKKDFVIMQSLFVDELIITIEKEGNVVTEADFTISKDEYKIEGEYTWNTDGKMIIKNTQNVPFGVIDLKIKNNLRK